MKKKLVLFCGSIFFNLLNLFAQSSPIVDNNWQLNLSKSDEFNTTSLDAAKWAKMYCCAGNCFGEGAMHPNNVIMNGASLLLKADSMIDPLSNCLPNKKTFFTAGVWTNNFEYNYGYLEIRAKLPGYYNNGQSCGKGFWPAFWTYYTGPLDPVSGCYNPHREIDILEPSGAQYADAKTNVHGWWTNQLNGVCPLKYGETTFHSPVPLFAGFHKYAVEWLPGRIVFYFDDVPYFASYNDPSVVDLTHRVVIDLQTSDVMNSNTPLPQYMEVDYFHYYELKKDCSSDVTILTNTQLNNFYYSIKRNITIGNSVNTITMSSGSNKTFRASNEIIINGEFTVPSGSELNLIPTPCF